jgi:hypothetical protein
MCPAPPLFLLFLLRFFSFFSALYAEKSLNEVDMEM